MSLHKGLIHALEILLPILEMPLIQNIRQSLMVVFIGSLSTISAGLSNKNRKKDENSVQGVWEGKTQKAHR